MADAPRPDPQAEYARDLLARADRVVVLTGAGISAESGVPTFRGADGLWNHHRAEELATPEAFRRDPRLVWEWYGWRRQTVAACAPNAAHRALARFALRRPGVRIITQNVDGLHTRAAHEEARALGLDPAPALPWELHGALFRARCQRCGAKVEDDGPIDASSADRLPHCAGCGGLMRPDIVWFGEPLDGQLLTGALREAASAQVCLVVGTSALVHPAASVPVATVRGGGDLIEIGLEDTPLTELSSVALRGGAASWVPALLE